MSNFIKTALLLIFLSASVSAQSYFKNWAKGTSSEEVGKRVAENWEARTFEFENGKRQFVIYP